MTIVTSMDRDHMREFWDARAREDALYFVDNRRVYRSRELDGFWEAGEQDLERLLTTLGLHIRSSDVALDIGCGVGRLTRVLARRAESVYALDVAPEMIERARSEHADLSNVRWIVGDGYSLEPLAEASVDACVSHVTFQHIPDPAITLAYVTEIGRVLKPGGWAAFQVSNDAAVHRPPRARLRARAAIGRSPRGQADPAWVGSAVSLDDLHVAAHSGGLELERIVGEGTQFCLVRARKNG
jgi:SAM-dependent methyltransferase